ncbi:MAG: hypothetical protein KF851_13115 [Pirellulaceae bacterium]|jgi:phage shock protein PspC (stress-responsive transcriptional regulator)|nr:hypothetical protein [Pirellulaceae bacterium]
MKFSIRFLFVLTGVLGAWFALWGFLMYASSERESAQLNLFIPITTAAPMFTLTGAAIFAWLTRWFLQPSRPPPSQDP